MHLIQALVRRALDHQGMELQMACGSLYGFWEWNLGPSQEQQVLLIAGLALKPMSFLFLFIGLYILLPSPPSFYFLP